MNVAADSLNPSPPSEAETRRRLIGAALVFVVTASWLGATAGDAGLTWDEGYYLGIALGYRRWFDGSFRNEHPGASRLDKKVLRAYWGLDPLRPGLPTLGQKHPPLGKLVSCAGIVLWGRAAGIILSARLAAVILSGILAASLFFWAAGRYDLRVATFSALALVFMPRLHAHLRLATLEPALLLTTALTVFAFVRGTESRAWAALTGPVFGLALLTKINAVLIPLALAPWGLLVHRRRAVPPLVSMAALGPLVFVMGWPALWADPIEGLMLYWRDKMVRSPIAVYYLGAYYKEVFAPWHYAVVMTLLTTPALVLAAAALGLARCWKEWRGRPAQARLDALMALTVAVPLLAATNPGMSRYDGVRLWLSAFPFLAVLAGRGAGWAWDAATAHWGARSWRAWLPAAAAACWLALPMGLMHPFQLSYYSELAGGPWGARRLGMETTYWFDTLTPRALAFLNEGLPRPKRVAFIPDEDRIYWMYRLDGYLGEDVQLSRLEHEWDYLVVVPRQGFIRSPDDPQMVALTRLMETRTPVWQEWLTPLRDIPVCLIYRNDRRH